MEIHKEVIGDCTLYLGDCMEIIPSIPSIDAVITDPPYGINANKQTLGKGKKDFYRGSDWDKKPPDIKDFLKLSKFLCVWGGNYFADQLPITNDWLIWHKKNDGRSFSECEMAWTNFGKQTRHLSHHWSGEKKLHPTMKPLKVMIWCIEQAGNIESIFDPFMGSGTTGVACVKLGKKFFGVEMDKSYFEIACERIHKEYSQKGLFSGDA